MRNYKFRGKTFNNQWVYGDLIQLHDGRKFIIDNRFGACIDDKGNFINTEAPFVNEVIPESIGQFTGLKDKNGKEVFEGDIVEFDDGEHSRMFVCKRNQHRAEYAWYTLNNEYIYPIGDLRTFLVVIGNIHDNPELLEVKE